MVILSNYDDDTYRAYGRALNFKMLLPEKSLVDSRGQNRNISQLMNSRTGHFWAADR